MLDFENCGSGNYQDAMMNTNLVRIGVVSEQWNWEWHHGPGGSRIGFLPKNADTAAILAEYAKRCKEHAEMENKIAKDIKLENNQIKAEYKRILEKYGKALLAELYKNSQLHYYHDSVKEIQKFDIFDEVFLCGNYLFLRKLTNETKVAFDVRINKNGGLGR